MSEVTALTWKLSLISETVLASVLFCWPSFLVTRWRSSGPHVLMWQHPKQKGMGRKKVLFSLGLPLTGSRMFPWAPERPSLYPGSEMPTCSSLHRSPSDGNRFPWVGLTPCAVRSSDSGNQECFLKAYQDSGLGHSVERRNMILTRKPRQISWWCWWGGQWPSALKEATKSRSIRTEQKLRNVSVKELLWTLRVILSTECLGWKQKVMESWSNSVMWKYR